MYYTPRHRALENGQGYHLAAFLIRRGRVVRVGFNSDKTHPRFKRQYPDGNWGSHMHAEMDVLRFAKPGDEIHVVRYQKSSMKMTMAKPCVYCEKHLKKAGIKKVRYTNWSGDWEELDL